MSAADKYGRVESMPSAALTQAQSAGQTLADKGVTYSAGAPQTPAVKYSAPVNNQLGRSLPQGRSL
jgi:hypothetical protein